MIDLILIPLLINYLASDLHQLKGELVEAIRAKKDFQQTKEEILRELGSLFSGQRGNTLDAIRTQLLNICDLYEVPSPYKEWFYLLVDDVFLADLEKALRTPDQQQREEMIRPLRDQAVLVTPEEYRTSDIEQKAKSFLQSLEFHIYSRPDSSLPFLHTKTDIIHEEVRDLREEIRLNNQTASELLGVTLEEATRLLSEHRYEDAMSLLDRVIEQENSTLGVDERSKLHYLRGTLQLELGDYGSSINSLKKSMAIKNTSEALLQYYQARLFEEGISDAIQAELRSEVNKNPEDAALASLMIGIIHLDAINDFRNSRPLNVQENDIFLLNLAVALNRHGRKSEAIDTMKLLEGKMESLSYERWEAHFKADAILNILVNKNAVRLLPQETEELEVTCRILQDYIYNLPKTYNSNLFYMALNDLNSARRFHEKPNDLEDCILKCAVKTGSQLACLFGAHIYILRREYKNTENILQKITNSKLFNEPAYFTSSFELYAHNRDNEKLEILYRDIISKLLSFCTKSDGSERDNVFALFQTALLISLILHKEAEVMGMRQFLESAHPTCSKFISALCYLNGLLPDFNTNAEQLVEDIKKAIESRDWLTIGLLMHVLRKLENYDLILTLAKDIFDIQVCSEHLFSALSVAQEQEDEEFTLHVLSKLFDAGYRDVDISCIYFSTLYWHQPNKAITIAKEFVKMFPQELNPHLILCQFASLENNPDLISLPDPIPDFWELSGNDRNLGVLTGLIMQGRIHEAEILAFDFYLKNPHDPSAQKGIFNLFTPFLSGQPDRLEIPINVTEVRDGVFIRCKDDLSGKNVDLWMVSNKAGYPLYPNHSPSDNFGSKLIGKHVGDKIEQDAFSSLEIMEIKDWRLAIYHIVLSELSSRTDIPKYMWSFSVKSEDPNTEADFTSLFKIMNKTKEETERILGLTREQALPLSMLAGGIHRDYAATWAEIMSHNDIPKIMRGDAQGEEEVSTEWFQSNRELILDESSILTAFLFETEDILCGYIERLRIPSFARRAFNDWVRNGSLGNAYMIFRNNVIPREPVSDIGTIYSQRIIKFKEFLDNISDVEAPIFLGGDRESRRALLFSLGRSGAQAVCYAQSINGLLLSDDFILKQLILTGFKIMSFSQLSFMISVARKEDRLVDFCAKAILLKYGGIPVSNPIVIKIYELIGWDADSNADEMPLSVLREFQRSSKDAIRQIALLIDSVFIECHLPELRERITKKILSKVFPNLSDRVKVEKILAFLKFRGRFGLTPLTSKAAEDTVQAWLNGKL